MKQSILGGKAPWLISYVAILIGAAGGMFWLRGAVMGRLQTAAAARDWNQWRTDVQEKPNNLGPVERRVPASAEPPALVLLRDYFSACLVAVVVGTGLVAGATMWFLRGALSQRRAEVGASGKENAKYEMRNTKSIRSTKSE